MADPNRRLIVTDRLCFEDIPDAVLSLRVITIEDTLALIGSEENGLSIFCIHAGQTFDALEEAGLIPMIGLTATISECLPLTSTDAIVVVANNGGRLVLREVSIELDDLCFLPAVAKTLDAAELIG